MATGIALLQEASHAILPECLARGNYKDAVTSGNFPVYLGSGVDTNNTFTLESIQNPYGYGGSTNPYISLDGADDYILSTNTQLIISQNRGFSVSITFKTTTLAQFYLLSPYLNTFNNFQLAWASSFFLARAKVGNVNTDSWISESIVPNTLYNVVVAFDGQKIQIYLNGTEGTYTLQNTFSGSDVTLSSGFYVGQYFSGGSNLSGSLYSFQMYDRLLTQAEITELSTLSLNGFEPYVCNAYGDNLEYARIASKYRSFLDTSMRINTSNGIW